MTLEITPSKIRAIIQYAIAAWTEGNASGFAALFTEDGELIVPGRRWVGPEAIQQAAWDFLKDSQVHIDVQQVLIQGQRAAVEWKWQETSKSHGTSSQADDVIMIDFVDGKIQRWREYIDNDTPAES